MKCPRYIQELLVRRVKLALAFNDVDYTISKWLDEHKIDCETYDTHLGVEAIVNPTSSAKRILEAIKSK